jgi:hypothetical protein
MKKNPHMSHRPTRRVIRLKRYEQPPEGYYEDFLREFHKRQRAEPLNTSVRGLMKERLSDKLSEFRVPAMAFAVAAGVAVLASIAVIRETPRQDNPRAYSVSYTPGAPTYQTPVTIQNVQPVSLRLDPVPQSLPQNSSLVFPSADLLPAPEPIR